VTGRSVARPVHDDPGCRHSPSVFRTRCGVAAGGNPGGPRPRSTPGTAP
jgi:hypothetical protein